MTKKLNLPTDELDVVPAVAIVPPEPDLPPLLDAPPEAEVPPVAPPLELLAADVPPELLVVPPDFDELLLALVPPEDALVPPELEDPPELEVPPELDSPPEPLPPDELTLLLFAPPDDAPPEDDDVWLDPPCPLRALPLLEPPLLLELFTCALPVSSAPQPPRAGIRIREEPNRIVHERVWSCFV